MKYLIQIFCSTLCSILFFDVGITKMVLLSFVRHTFTIVTLLDLIFLFCICLHFDSTLYIGRVTRHILGEMARLVAR
jgi:hypothetical protein